MSRFKPNLNKLESGFGYDGELAEVELSWINDDFGNTCLKLHYIPVDDDLRERYPEKFSLGKAVNWEIEGDQLYSVKENAGVNKNSNYARYFKPSIDEAVKGTDWEKLFFDALGGGNLTPIKRMMVRLKTVKVLQDDGTVKKRKYTNKEGEEKEGDADRVVIGSIEKMLTTAAKSQVEDKVDFEDTETYTKVLEVVEENISKPKVTLMAQLMKNKLNAWAKSLDWLEEAGYTIKSNKIERKK